MQSMIQMLQAFKFEIFFDRSSEWFWTIDRFGHIAKSPENDHGNFSGDVSYNHGILETESVRTYSLLIFGLFLFLGLKPVSDVTMQIWAY